LGQVQVVVGNCDVLVLVLYEVAVQIIDIVVTGGVAVLKATLVDAGAVSL
jgi:hypothetical protein